jgi:hypothetical protein
MIASRPAWAQVGDARPTVSTFDGTGAHAWDGNVRASDAELIALLAEGVKKSPTLRGLVERLNKSNVIVYVRMDVTSKQGTGRLTFLTANAGFRYLVVHVPTGVSKVKQIVALGHDMQHAVVVADAPTVTDLQSFRREFERIGSVSSNGRDLSFASPAAVETKNRIQRELAGDTAAQKVASN